MNVISYVIAGSIFLIIQCLQIARLNTSRKFELYNEGIIEFEDIPEDEPLNDKQWMQVNAELNNTEYIDREGLREFIETIKYPLYFMDFETFMPAIPLFDNSRPYQQIPFQYSLHYQKEPTTKKTSQVKKNCEVKRSFEPV